MSNNIIQMSTYRGDKSALDEFLPERALAPDVRQGRPEGASGADLLSPADVVLEPIENFPPSVALKPAPVQLWPMLAAALVTLGFGILALGAFAKFFHPTV